LIGCGFINIGKTLAGIFGGIFAIGGTILVIIVCIVIGVCIIGFC
jgi:hypothetical protein